jgi:hypothetical protein
MIHGAISELSFVITGSTLFLTYTVISSQAYYDDTTRRILPACLAGCWMSSFLSLLRDFVNYTY